MLSAIAKFHNPDIETTLATHYLLSQYVMKKVVKLFGECGVMSVKKDTEKLQERKVIKPRLPRDLTGEQKRRSLSYLMFLKEKIYGSIKGRGCADGRPQRLWMKK